ncbi:RHS repeat domain-containing protein [Corynebacterium variabile]|uniref:RHS repeat domain-containing protein n=1 Tax=Corynebacterium variabile TaxID=1727 RepID=UPI003A8CAF0F
MWDRDRSGQFTVDDPFEAKPGRIWVTDPGTGESLGQIDLGTESTSAAPQSAVDATFFAMVADMAGAPRELLDTDTGEIAGRASQSLYGRRTWRGRAASPLLFSGQYEDTESGWAYNRFRFYDPVAGVYGAQDPLGVGPKIATAQGYVDHAQCLIDSLGLANTSGHNVAAMITKDGDTYFAMGATRDLTPSLHPSISADHIVTESEISVFPSMSKGERLPLHAEQKLLRFAEANGMEVQEIHSVFPICERSIAPNLSCSSCLREAGLIQIQSSQLCEQCSNTRLDSI